MAFALVIVDTFVILSKFCHPENVINWDHAIMWAGNKSYVLNAIRNLGKIIWSLYTSG